MTREREPAEPDVTAAEAAHGAVEAQSGGAATAKCTDAPGAFEGAMAVVKPYGSAIARDSRSAILLPRDEGPGATELCRVLCVQDQYGEDGLVRQMLQTLHDPCFVVEVATDLQQAFEALSGSAFSPGAACGGFDVVFVELRSDRKLWTRFIRDRRTPNIAIIALDYEGRAGERSLRRAQAMKEGAAAYIRRAELSQGLLENTIFHALERVRMQRTLNDVQERFALAVRGAHDGVWEWILETGEMHFSRRWRELLGYGVDDLSNTVDEWFDRVHPDDIEGLKADVAAHLAGEKPFHEHEHRIRASDGTYRWVISRAVAQRDGGRVVRMAGSLSDTSDFRQREERLREETRYDTLTGLPRREPFMEDLARAIRLTQASPDYVFTVLMVDVDRFRWLADSIGHQAADGMLAILAKRLLSCVRPGDTVCRFGGDKFAILLENLGDVSVATDIASRIRVSVHEPFDVDGQTVYTTVSTGLTTSARGYSDPDEIISDVAAAANKAKERGQDRHEVFDSKMRSDALTTLRLEVALRQAVERDEFELHYQPIVDLDSGRLVGFEALTRWQHPRRGIVNPTEFIPVAEQTGLILPIGRWAIREALWQLRRWQDTLMDTGPLSMSVNLSARQVADVRLLDEIVRLLEEYRIEPGTLRLELTESVLIDNGDAVHRMLSSLRDVGVRIWVDDFGTGYSSLSYLHRFPVDGLKIDKSFVDAIDGSEQGAAVIRTILTLAEHMGVDVVAEGIETSLQADQLLKIGCKRGQGFLFGRPLAAARVRQWVDDSQDSIRH